MRVPFVCQRENVNSACLMKATREMVHSALYLRSLTLRMALCDLVGNNVLIFLFELFTSVIIWNVN